VEAGVHFAEDCIGFVFSGRQALAGVSTGQDFDALFDRGDRIKVELALGYGFDHFFAQHQVVHVFRRDQHALISGETFHFADIVEAFDFLVHAAHRLNVSLLIHGAGDR